VRFALLVLDLSAAVSAILGGIAVAGNVDGFPPEWLAGTPFSGYLAPGLILAVVVGGSAAAAAVTTARPGRLGPIVSVVAGVVLVGWILGELVLLNQNSAASSPRSPVEAIYLLVGIAMAGLGAYLWRSARGAAAAA
jgi:hypothetical protein